MSLGGRTPTPVLLVNGLAKLTADAASYVAGIVGLTDSPDRRSEVTVFMVHQCARDAHDTLRTMEAWSSTCAGASLVRQLTTLIQPA
jgi:hypothetical protein